MTPHRCEACGQSFSDSSLYASHHCLTRRAPLPSRTALEKFKCSQCSQVFAEPSPLKCHFESLHIGHGPEAPFHCTEQGCQFKTGDEKEYRSHLMATHRLTPIPCSFQSCKASFRTQGEMESHKKSHMPFGCFHCEFVTQNDKELRDHLQEHKADSQGTEATAGSSYQSNLSRRKKRRKSNTAHDDKYEKASDVQGHTVKRARRTVRGDKYSAVDVAAQPSKEYLAEGAEHIYRTHTCPKCRRCFKMRSHLQEHLHLHDPDPSLQCPTCKRYFTSKSKLRIHRLREAGEKLHQCHLCGYSAVERNAIRRHLVTMHADEADDSITSQIFPCPTCGLRFRQSRLLKAHMKMHNILPDSKPVACFREGCTFESSLRKAILKHAAEVHSVKAVECRHHACGAIFPGEKEMESHYRTHLAYHCSQCDFTCSNKTTFLQHERHGHSGINKLCCDFCTFFTFNPVEFDQHIGHLHASEKIHRCSQCSYVTSHKRGLKRHMLMHSDEKPHKCSLCEFRCRDESYLSKHMLTHSSDKNFMCAECGYVTKWKHYLNVHMRKHAGDLRYQCDQCPYRCHRMDQLNSHKLRHQAKTLICEVCGYACKRKYELHNHMLAKHSGDGKQPSVLKCKYCTYTTCYRQALQNHENCKHTKLKEFRCALCFYSSFSSISLFLHKRKAHGYVPGDKAWLENYAAKEKERNSTEILRAFYKKPSVGNEPSGQSTEEPPPTAQREQSDLHVSADQSVNKGAGAASQAASSLSLLDVACQEVVHEGVPDTPLSGNSPEYCTLVLTTLSAADYETPSLHNEEEANSPIKSTFISPEEGNTADKECEESEVDDHFESQKDTNQRVEPEKCQRETPGIQNNSEMMSSVLPPEQNPSEIRMKAMRKHDRDQAEAMVLEGRVQMLVVPTKDIYHCDKCSYVTRKETAFKYHCRSLCLSHTQGHECQSCGALFKQQRGLDGHLVKRCPAVPRKTRTLSAPHLVTERNGSKQLGGGTNLDQTKFLSNQDLQQQEEVCSSTLTESEHQQCTKETGNDKGTNDSPTKAALYTEEDGRFKCKLCNFSAVRLATVNRHISSCQKSLGKEQSSVISEDTDKLSDSKKGKGRAVEKSGSAVSEKGQTFSCPHCTFKCSQKKVLERHQKGGCQKSSGFQCTTCSFVAKSNRSLNQHILQAHDGKRASLAKPKHLNCQSCTFTCKQERRMAQHVALKHEGERPHRCRYCSFSTTRRYRLEEHESIHTGIGRHICDLCDKTFGTVTKLRQHKMRVHDRQPSHPCSLCDFSGYTLDDVRRHKLRCHTGELQHACTHCDAHFSSEVALRNHRKRVHKLQAFFSCEQCDFSSTAEVTLKSHQQTKHQEVKCATCQETFQTKEDLETHQKTHLVHQCQLCPFAAKTRQLLAQHLLSKHEEGSLQDKPLKCSSCQFACQHQLVLEQHLRSHGGSRLYKCTNCKYSTRNKQKITWHIRIHTGEKPYSCEQCSYSCTDPSRLKLHMRVHQDEKKYLCPECGYKCKWATQLKYHMTKHTGERPYACDECEYRTNRADALRAHRDTQHCDMRPYVCEKCGKAFKTSFILKTHQRQHSDDRPYTCGLCHKAFRWPAGLRHHYLSHTKQQPFCCRHCSYRAKQKFQVVKHLHRHHPEMPVEQGVVRDSEAAGLTLKEALQGRLDERAAEDEERGGPDYAQELEEDVERKEASKTKH